MKQFLKSLLIAICFGVAFTPARADTCNLFDISKLTSSSNVINNNDGTITAIGYAAQADGRLGLWAPDLKVGDVVTLSAESTGTNKFIYLNGPALRWDFGTSQTITADMLNSSVRFYGEYGSSNPVIISKVKLEEGSTATAYQPYNPLCATCDGTVVSYETATGAVSIPAGTPSLTNTIYPTFYTQGDMTLRALKGGDDRKDVYDATTDKITRKVDVRVFDGTENCWSEVASGTNYVRYGCSGFKTYPDSQYNGEICSHFPYRWQWNTVSQTGFHNGVSITSSRNIYFFEIRDTDPMYESVNTLKKWKTWLAAQATANTPLTVYYLLKTEEEEPWATTSYCRPSIKIATTKYNNAQFTPVVNALNTAVSTIKDVVANTITQTAAIAQIASDKQTRPSSGCPTGKTCLLVEDMNGEPHWYEIIEEYIPPEPEGPEPTPVSP